MPEQYANFSYTTLANTLNATDETLTVVSNATFPDTPYRIAIDREIILVNAQDGTTWSVTRAREGSTGVIHPSGSKVEQVLTAGGLIQAINDYGGGGGNPTLPITGNNLLKVDDNNDVVLTSASNNQIIQVDGNNNVELVGYIGGESVGTIGFDSDGNPTINGQLVGSAAYLTAGTNPNNVVTLDESGALPAVDGSQLTGITAQVSPLTADLNTAGHTIRANSGDLVLLGYNNDITMNADGAVRIATNVTTPSGSDQNLYLGADGSGVVAIEK
jgi:hypothetical protein